MEKENNNKTNNKTNTESVTEWFDIADDDIAFAKASFEEFDEFYSQMCIQAHQATEKYLKGFLVFHKKSFPKVHDLAYFIEQCSKIDKEFNEYLDFCKKITDYYIYLRYPVTLPPRTKEQAKEAIEIAENIGYLAKTKTNIDS